MKHQEDSIMDMQRFLLSLINNAPCGIIAVDKKGSITAINPLALKLLNKDIDMDLPVIMDIFELTEGLDLLRDPLNRCLEGKRKTFDLAPVRFGRKSLSIKGHHLPNGVILVIEDITKFKKVQSTLEDLQLQLKNKIDELESINKKKDDFISITAHELKTPLTSIMGFSQLLQDKKLQQQKEAEQKKDFFLGKIIHDSRRLDKLVTDILDLSRIDLKTIKWKSDKMALKEIVNELQEWCRKNILVEAKKEIKIVYDFDAKSSSFYSDKEKIVRVLSNLIENAVKFTKSGEIRFKAFPKDGFMNFSLTDTGIGISKKNQERVFDRFYQVDSSFTRCVGGTGIGLAICKELLEQAGFSIWVKSQLNKGSTFEFKVSLK